MGRPISKEQMESSLQRLATAFQQLPNCQASREHFGAIAKVKRHSLHPYFFFFFSMSISYLYVN